MAKLGKKGTGILAGVASVLAVASLASVIATNSRVSQLETTERLSASAYSIGLLSDTTGKLPSEESERDLSGLSTNKFYKYDGLKVEVDNDAKVKYQVNYFDEDKKFLSVQTWTYDFTESSVTQTGVVYVKIEIIPTDDDDGEVTIFEQGTYANLITVTVQK